MSESTLSFADRIRNAELLLGTVISIRSAEMTEVLSQCGFDWLFIDAEHGGFDPHDALQMLQAAGNCPCLIRVPAHDEVWLKKALDIGPAGIIVPQVNNANEAQKIIDFCKYPPTGTRGMGVSRASQYGLNLGDYIKTANTTTAILLQAEHKDAATNIEEIVKVEGLDAILVGPFDMSASFGKPGQVSDPEVLSAIDAITQACQKAGVTLATAVADAEDARSYIEKGYTLVSSGVDSLHLIKSAKQTLTDLRKVKESSDFV
jgi:4-hydroxy-2-oxoheptanedioate aldolase